MKDCCNHNEAPKDKVSEHSHSTDEHGHSSDDKPQWQQHLGLLIGLAFLIIFLTLDYGFGIKFSKPISFAINALAYVLAGWDVLKLAFRKAIRGDIFNEFVLMTVATLGAFYIGEYSEGVAVMVFYAIGEWFQDAAVDRAKANIKDLLDIRPNEVTVLQSDIPTLINATNIKINDILLIKPGEKVGLDGELISDNAAFNTAALTGESKPDTKYKGDAVLAGMINLNTVVQIRVTALFQNSKLSKILEMVQDASSRKSQTQLFISKFAKVYTPIVFFLALVVVLAPLLVVDDYIFTDWLYRALVFLVISCPCALVVSIPLGYFGGIGLASKNGILFKGGNFLDVMTKIDTVVMDKTGTLTKAVFKVQKVVANGISEDELLRLAAILESNSTHPVAKAIVSFAPKGDEKATSVEEIAGHGLVGKIGADTIIAGNLKLLNRYKIIYPAALENMVDTAVILAVNGNYVGYISIADEIKEDALEAIAQLHQLNIKTVMLSGDKQAVVDQVAKYLGITTAHGDLLPEGKVAALESLKQIKKHIAFVGDGVNDAPVLALADAGIAMGGLGSDAAIETADIVIQNDQLLKIVSAIKIGKLTKAIVWQNITLAMVVKIAVLSLGAFGVANLWEAVIADVGVALLAILNAIRIQHKQV